jgi:hypothetical protein
MERRASDGEERKADGEKTGHQAPWGSGECVQPEPPRAVCAEIPSPTSISGDNLTKKSAVSLNGRKNVAVYQGRPFSKGDAMRYSTMPVQQRIALIKSGAHWFAEQTFLKDNPRATKEQAEQYAADQWRDFVGHAIDFLACSQALEEAEGEKAPWN